MSIKKFLLCAGGAATARTNESGHLNSERRGGEVVLALGLKIQGLLDAEGF